MKSPFLTGLEERHRCSSPVAGRSVVDVSTWGQAALLVIGLGVALMPAETSATALPSSIDADVIRGFAVDGGAASGKAPVAAVNITPAAPPAKATPSVPPVSAPAEPPVTAQARADTGGSRAAMDPAVIHGFATPAVIATPPETRQSRDEVVVEAPVSVAPAAASVSEPAADNASNAGNAGNADQSGADTGSVRAAIDPDVIRGFARPAIKTPPAATERVESAPVQATAPAPQPPMTPAPMATPGTAARPPAQPIAPAAAEPRPAPPSAGRSPIDGDAIRGFANTQWAPTAYPAAADADAGQPAASPVPAAGSAGDTDDATKAAPTPLPTASADGRMQTSELHPMPQSDMDQIRAIFAPEM